MKVPEEVHVVDEIPKSGSGKIKRHELAERMPAYKGSRPGGRPRSGLLTLPNRDR